MSASGEAANEREIPAVGQDGEELEQAGEAPGEVNLETPLGKTVDDGLRGLLGRLQGRHGEIVPGGELGGHEARIDRPHADTLRRQVEIQAFGKVDQRRLARPVAQGLGQAAITGHAGHEGNAAARVQIGQDGRRQAHGAVEIDGHHLLGNGQVEIVGPHRHIVAGQID